MIKYKDLTITNSTKLKFLNKDVKKIYYMNRLIYNYEEEVGEYQLLTGLSNNGGRAYAEIPDLVADQTWAAELNFTPYSIGFVFGSRTSYLKNTFGTYVEPVSSISCRCFSGFGTDNWIMRTLTFPISPDPQLTTNIEYYGDIYKTVFNEREFINDNNNDYQSLEGVYIGALKSDSRRSSVDFFKVKFYKSGELKYDLKPAKRLSDNVVGFLNIVDNLFYPSISEYQFLALEIPTENTRLTYLINDGGSYFDTGLFSNSRYRIEGSIEISSAATEGWVFGARDKYVSNGMGFFNGTTVFTAYNSALTAYQPKLQSNIKYEYVFQPGSLVVTNTVTNEVLNYNVPGDGNVPDDKKVEIRFNGNRIAYDGVSMDTRYFKGKIFEMRIYDIETNTLVRNYVPMFVVDGFKVCMYDTVNNTYNFSETEKSFIAGPYL